MHAIHNDATPPVYHYIVLSLCCHIIAPATSRQLRVGHGHGPGVVLICTSCHTAMWLGLFTHLLHTILRHIIYGVRDEAPAPDLVRVDHPLVWAFSYLYHSCRHIAVLVGVSPCCDGGDQTSIGLLYVG